MVPNMKFKLYWYFKNKNVAAPKIDYIWVHLKNDRMPQLPLPKLNQITVDDLLCM
jgi:hypothetical protein